MNRNLTALAVAPLLALGATSSLAAHSLVLSGNYCSVAPIANPVPGLDLNGWANQAASLNIGPNEWFSDFTDSRSVYGAPAASYSSVGTANGLTGNTVPGNGTSSGPNPYTNMFFNDKTAVPTGVTASWDAGTQDSFDDRSQVASRRDQLFGGYLQRNFEGAATSTITLSLAGLDLINGGDPYDLYVYVDGEDRKGPIGQTGEWQAAVGSTTYYGLDDTDFFDNAGGTGTQAYTRVTNTTGTYTSGNYVLFEGLTGDSFTFTISSATRGVVLNAWELRFAPVPAPLALMAAGLIALGASRRRAK